MRIVNLSHVVNLRLTSDVPTALDRHLGATNWRYVGWEQPRLGLERSPLANPYSCKPRHNRQRVHVPTRQTAIQGYRQWLWETIQAEDEAVLAALRALREEQVLVCWCRPKPCHATIIARAAQWLRDQAEGVAPRVPVPRLLRERTHNEEPCLLFDLDQGYLKVTSKRGSHCFGLRDWVWPYSDTTPAVVREEGSVRHTTTGALMGLLARCTPVVDPQTSVPETDFAPILPLHPAVEAVRQRYAPESTVSQRERCQSTLADLRLPAELMLLSDGSLLDVSYGQGSESAPTSVDHYPVGGVVDIPSLMAHLTAGEAVRVGSLTYHPR